MGRREDEGGDEKGEEVGRKEKEGMEEEEERTEWEERQKRRGVKE